MKPFLAALFRTLLFLLNLPLWAWALNQAPSVLPDLLIIVGGIVLVVPVSWLGKKVLNRDPTTRRAFWVTVFIHFAVLVLLGTALIRAIVTHAAWIGWRIPLPVELSWVLVLVTGAAALGAVLNLAWKGLGAPFALILSRRLTADWMYAWTRNPMVLATLAFLLALGLWFQSALFVLWVLGLFSPALLAFVKIYEERELEIRFGASYLAYKSRTPMLFPRRPRG